jgi:predicted lipoprotein with Yx(FWY)xxD motif
MRMTGYRPGSVIVLLLALVVAACAPAGPAVEPETPSPVPAGEATPDPTPEPTTEPTPEPTTTPASIDYDYDYGDQPAATPAAAAGSDELHIGVMQDAEGNDYLVGRDGLALYIFTVDERDRSNCDEACAEAWPPLLHSQPATLSAEPEVIAGVGGFMRDDGTMQISYDRMPLYYYAGDSAAGDTHGEGVGGVWFLARP